MVGDPVLMQQGRYHSWGRYPKITNLNQDAVRLYDRSQIVLGSRSMREKLLLPFGNGRSYGDSCLNNDGKLLDTRGLDRFISFDQENGVLRCESGVLLSEIIELILPYGWFLKVTPGTRFITIGGAVANDVHGKNHHRVGSFGSHVRCFELLRSDDEKVVCSLTENSELFSATIGGLGLTGLIVWVEISLQKIESEFVDVETICFDHLPEFFSLSKESDTHYEHTVAWIDCLAKGDQLGRGLFMRANYTKLKVDKVYTEKKISFPIDPPFSLINRASLKVFNSLYRWTNCIEEGEHLQHLYPFFYPLDAIQNWNRIYGNNGFFQYQCVIPEDSAKPTIEKILKKISTLGIGSFLAVLKNFGSVKSPGILSFPRTGTTLALDFPNHGVVTLDLFNMLDEFVVSAGGALYPAKDVRMSGDTFKTSFPAWEDFSKFIDPNFSSSFWRRVTDKK